MSELKMNESTTSGAERGEGMNELSVEINESTTSGAERGEGNGKMNESTTSEAERSEERESDDMLVYQAIIFGNPFLIKIEPKIILRAFWLIQDQLDIERRDLIFSALCTRLKIDDFETDDDMSERAKGDGVRDEGAKGERVRAERDEGKGERVRDEGAKGEGDKHCHVIDEKCTPQILRSYTETFPFDGEFRSGRRFNLMNVVKPKVMREAFGCRVKNHCFFFQKLDANSQYKLSEALAVDFFPENLLEDGRAIKFLEDVAERCEYLIEHAATYWKAVCSTYKSIFIRAGDKYHRQNKGLVRRLVRIFGKEMFGKEFHFRMNFESLSHAARIYCLGFDPMEVSEVDFEFYIKELISLGADAYVEKRQNEWKHNIPEVKARIASQETIVESTPISEIHPFDLFPIGPPGKTHMIERDYWAALLAKKEEKFTNPYSRSPIPKFTKDLLLARVAIAADFPKPFPQILRLMLKKSLKQDLAGLPRTTKPRAAFVQEARDMGATREVPRPRPAPRFRPRRDEAPAGGTVVPRAEREWGPPVSEEPLTNPSEETSWAAEVEQTPLGNFFETHVPPSQEDESNINPSDEVSWAAEVEQTPLGNFRETRAPRSEVPPSQEEDESNINVSDEVYWDTEVERPPLGDFHSGLRVALMQSTEGDDESNPVPSEELIRRGLMQMVFDVMSSNDEPDGTERDSPYDRTEASRNEAISIRTYTLRAPSGRPLGRRLREGEGSVADAIFPGEDLTVEDID